ncbi:14350_t:CDS:1 [Dentiscutata erythropus]|uniref:Terpene synthase n=1 Tax=Dentiscutata erythropus TaxID=1348616 RepID=A0A9N8YPF6_9GLOM|nr:14350_t:CDS:1 [Dentiscutata erythropus]
MPKSKKESIKSKNKEPTEWNKGSRIEKLRKTKLIPQSNNQSNNINTLNESHKILESLNCNIPLRARNYVSKEEVLKIEKHCYEWAKKFELIKKKTTNKEFKGSKFGLLICYIFPTASFERRCLAIDFFNWLFFVDDLIDDNNKNLKPEEIKTVLDKFKSILDDNLQSEVLQSPLVIALWDVWARMKKITNEIWRMKFRNTILLYFDACYLNAQNEFSNKFPNSVEEYIKIRRNSGAVMTSFNLIEPLLGIQISYDNKELRNLMEYCNDHICFINDIYSLQKELLEGGVDNIIIVLCHLHQSSLQEAVNYAVELINQRMTQIQEIANKFMQFNLENNQDISKYVNALLDIVVGSFHWHKMSGRYSIKKNETMV